MIGGGIVIEARSRRVAVCTSSHDCLLILYELDLETPLGPDNDSEDHKAFAGSGPVSR